MLCRGIDDFKLDSLSSVFTKIYPNCCIREEANRYYDRCSLRYGTEFEIRSDLNHLGKRTSRECNECCNTNDQPKTSCLHSSSSSWKWIHQTRKSSFCYLVVPCTTFFLVNKALYRVRYECIPSTIVIV